MAVMSITFGGINSANYGIYIGGEGTFNAPVRDVEMVEVPGRNGNLIVDNGRFENIEVKYSAINQEPDLATFSANLEAFRNAIASQKGYQRLTDSFHPTEYRMATFRSGLEINPIEYNTASEFEIVFDCKPQRFLTSGETETSVTSGGTITNPTLFDSQPLLKLKGYGNILINGETTKVEYKPYGKTLLHNEFRDYSPVAWLDEGALGLLNTGDNIYLYKYSKIVTGITALFSRDQDKITAITAQLGGTIDGATVTAKKDGPWDVIITVTLPTCRFDYNTFTELRDTVSGTITYTYGGTTYTRNYSAEVVVQYADNNYYGQYIRLATENVTTGSTLLAQDEKEDTCKSIYASSTKLIYADNLYLDCDLGEAYTLINGEPTSINNVVAFPSDLPVLKPGANEITYDNTITSFAVTPRWWKV